MRLTPKALYRWWREDGDKQRAANAASDLDALQQRAREAQQMKRIGDVGDGGPMGRHHRRRPPG